MRQSSIIAGAALIAALAACRTPQPPVAAVPASDTNSSMTSRPPVAKIVPHRLEIHGDPRVDDYYWLRERENPEVIAYLEAENAYTAARMSHLEPLQEELFNEIVARIPQSDESVPV